MFGTFFVYVTGAKTMTSIQVNLFSEALILASTNPQYDKRLFIDLPVQYMKTKSSEYVVHINWGCCFCFNIQNNLLLGAK